MPKISVIVPVYKVEPYLHRCVESILNQSFSDFELILVDDGSPDNCGAICDAYAEKDIRVRVIHQENGGLSAARNAGIDWAFAHSDSEWLAFIDSDDWVHKEYLQILYSAATQNNVHFSACGLEWTDCMREDHEYKNADPYVLDVETAFVEHQEKCTPAWGKIIKKELFRDLLFPVGKLHEDAFITHFLLFSGEMATVNTEKLYYYYNNPVSITRAKWSDRKLDSIEAHEQRLKYFREQNFQRAYRHEQKIYVEELTAKAMHLVNTRESKTAYADSLALLQNKLRFALKQAVQDGAVTWNRETFWSYIFTLKTDAAWKMAISMQKLYHRLKK